MKIIKLTMLALLLCVSVRGQNISGSTGADGAFNPPSSVPPGTTIQGANNQGNCTQAAPCVVTVPVREPNPGEAVQSNGHHVFNFTTVNIGQYVTVNFTPNKA